MNNSFVFVFFQNDRIRNLKRDIDSVRCEAAKLEASIKHKREELEKKTAEIQRECTNLLLNVCFMEKINHDIFECEIIEREDFLIILFSMKISVTEIWKSF